MLKCILGGAFCIHSNVIWCSIDCLHYMEILIYLTVQGSILAVEIRCFSKPELSCTAEFCNNDSATSLQNLIFLNICCCFLFQNSPPLLIQIHCGTCTFLTREEHLTLAEWAWQGTTQSYPNEFRVVKLLSLSACTVGESTHNSTKMQSNYLQLLFECLEKNNTEITYTFVSLFRHNLANIH